MYIVTYFVKPIIIVGPVSRIRSLGSYLQSARESLRYRSELFIYRKKLSIRLIYHVGNKIGDTRNVGKRKKLLKKKDENKNLQLEGN